MKTYLELYEELTQINVDLVCKDMDYEELAKELYKATKVMQHLIENIIRKV